MDASLEVTLRLPGALRELVGGSSTLALRLPAGASVRTLLDTLAVEWPALERRLRDERGELRRYVNVYVGEDDVRMSGLDTPLPAGAQVLEVPCECGGSRHRAQFPRYWPC